jgi:hypothetical protein
MVQYLKQVLKELQEMPIEEFISRVDQNKHASPWIYPWGDSETPI